MGGIVFLLPVAVFLIVIGKLVVGLKAVAGRLAPFLPVESVGGFVVLNVVALTIALCLCLPAGLVAQGATGQRIRSVLEDWLLSAVPGYSFVMGLGDRVSLKGAGHLMLVTRPQETAKEIEAFLKSLPEERN